ncbi:pheromone A receptor-domain-containing protein [Chiua virens]|nr:pheromone A receptor-domain-containing protein [Chiua virens]
MYDKSNIVFIVLAAIGSLLVIIPLPKAISSGNLGTTSLIVWTELACVIQLVNAIRWNQNAVNWAPVWCDFCGYFLIATDFALVATGVAINRQLYMIVTLNPRRHERNLNLMVDTLFCLVLPGFTIALEYVVQQYRFFIFEDVGCVAGIGNVTLAYPLVWMLPVLMGVVSVIYVWFIIRASFTRRHSLISDSGTNSTWSRQLLAIGILSTMYGFIPTTMAIVFSAIAYPVLPWPGWNTLHSTIDVIVYVPAQEWQANILVAVSVQLRRWTILTLAYVIFAVLGLTTDVRKMYLSYFRNAFNQTSSIHQTGSVSKRNTHENASGHEAPNHSSVFYGKPGADKRHEGFCLEESPRSRFDPDLEDFQIVCPPPPAKHRAPSWECAL